MSRSVIGALRDFIPITALSRERALRLAALQAARFRTLTGQRDPELATDAIADLPHLHVVRLSPLPVSGATAWSNGQWQILLRGSEPIGRQRFSLAHEFKHILDHRFVDVLYTAIPDAQRDAFMEQVCDYFAGCLLVPEQHLRDLYRSGTTDIGELAATFNVSQPAIQTRLAQTGLSRPQKRCGVNADWALQTIESADSSSASYSRSLHPLWAGPAIEGVPV